MSCRIDIDKMSNLRILLTKLCHSFHKIDNADANLSQYFLKY